LSEIVFERSRPTEFSCPVRVKVVPFNDPEIAINRGIISTQHISEMIGTLSIVIVSGPQARALFIVYVGEIAAFCRG